MLFILDYFFEKGLSPNRPEVGIVIFLFEGRVALIFEDIETFIIGFGRGACPYLGPEDLDNMVLVLLGFLS